MANPLDRARDALETALKLAVPALGTASNTDAARQAAEKMLAHLRSDAAAAKALADATRTAETWKWLLLAVGAYYLLDGD